MAYLFCSLVFAGCSSLSAGPANSVRPGVFGVSHKTQVVIGVTQGESWDRIVFSKYNPETHYAGTCARHDHFGAGALESQTEEVRYLVFDVEPGIYARTHPVWTHSQAGPVAFEVPAGQRVYFGTYRFQGRETAYSSDLVGVQKAMGDASSSLTRAETFDDARPVWSSAIGCGLPDPVH